MLPILIELGRVVRRGLAGLNGNRWVTGGEELHTEEQGAAD